MMWVIWPCRLAELYGTMYFTFPTYCIYSKSASACVCNNCFPHRPDFWVGSNSTVFFLHLHFQHRWLGVFAAQLIYLYCVETLNSHIKEWIARSLLWRTDAADWYSALDDPCSNECSFLSMFTFCCLHPCNKSTHSIYFIKYAALFMQTT